MPDPGTPRRRSRDDVTATALRLLDEHGLPDLTMRHLATALGVAPSALYWHFPNKQALLAAVSASVLAPLEALSLDDVTLQDAVRVVGTRLRECLLAHRDASELVSSSLALGLVDPPVRPHLLAVARASEAPESLAEVAAETVTHFVVGFTFHEQQRLAADSLGLLMTAGPAGEARPEDATADPVGVDAFTAALTMIADGVDASLRVTRTAGRGAGSG